jgi:putative methylase
MTFPIKKKNLISIVQSMDGFETPDVQLEQYITDAISTVDFLYFIAVDNNDILGNIILDLGAGTGRLGLTSLLMGAESVVAIEKDANAIRILEKNAKELELTDYLTIIRMDISKISDIHCDSLLATTLQKSSSNTKIVCVMNPPFGVQIRNADRPFLQLAMNLSDKIYSIHLSNPKTRSYLQRFVESYGWNISSIHSQKMILEENYAFHKQKRKQIVADVYKMEKKRD